MFGSLATLFVDIKADTRSFDRSLAGLRSRLSGLGSMRLPILGGGLGFAALAGGLEHALKAGSDLNESLNKVGVIFGRQASTVTASADAMADKFGVVKSDFLDMSAEFGNVLQQMGGQTEKEAAEMSVVLAKVAGDATSLFNAKDFKEAASKISSGLQGMSRPVGRYGADIHEAAVKQEALRLGLAGTARELSTQDKVLARTSLMLQGLNIASGDLDATIKGYANATRSAEGRMENMAAMIGQQLLPAFEEWRALQNEVLIDLTAKTADGASMLEDFTGFVKGMVRTLGVIWRNWSEIVQYTSLIIMEKLYNIGDVVAYLRGVCASFLAWFAANWSGIIADAINASRTAIKNLSDDFWTLARAVASVGTKVGSGEIKGPKLDKSFAKGLADFGHDVGKELRKIDGMKSPLQGFVAKTPEFRPPELKMTSFAQAFRELDDRMLANEQRHADAVAFGAAERPERGRRILPGEVEAGARKKEGKFEVVSLEDSWRKIQEGIGNGADRNARRGADAAVRAADQMQQMNAMMKANAANVQAGAEKVLEGLKAIANQLSDGIVGTAG